MLLFVGLGNPTPDSENNRHNVGFKIIDSIPLCPALEPANFAFTLPNSISKSSWNTITFLASILKYSINSLMQIPELFIKVKGLIA